MKNLLDHPFWGRGFRPFFFLGALYSVISIGIWGGFYAGVLVPPDFAVADPVAWHAHEMIYGFTMAIVAGFLLTAVANWTGGAPVRQVRLVALCLLWVLGRVVFNVDMGLSPTVICGAEVIFIPALAAALAVPLIGSWNKRNFVFLALLGVLLGCDLWFMMGEERTPLYVALTVILAMVSLIGGRIIPAFTVAALRRKGVMAVQVDQGRMDLAALLSLVFVALTLALGQENILLTVAALASAALHALRMRHYHSLKTGSDPLVWILHAGYGWLVTGLVLLALTGMGFVEIKVVLHALTVGCIGSMTLGMICRVTLGHTGRDLRASRLTGIGFFMMQIAAVTRTFGPLFLPDYMQEWIIISASLWMFCFLVYLIIYAPMLMGARPDGQEA